MRSLITLIFVGLLSGCSQGSIVRNIEIDASKDTTLILQKRGYFDGATLKVIGTINDDAVIHMQHPDMRNFNLHKEISLKKGYNNRKQGLSNIYDYSFHVVYYHKNVSEGKLKLIVSF